MDGRKGKLITSSIPRPFVPSTAPQKKGRYQKRQAEGVPQAEPQVANKTIEKPVDPGECPKLSKRSAKQVAVSVGIQLALLASAAYIVFSLGYMATESYLNFFEDLSGCKNGQCPKGYDAYAGSQYPQNLKFLYVGLALVGITVWKTRRALWKGIDWLFTLSASQHRKQDTEKLQQHVVKSADFVRQNELYLTQLANNHNKMLTFRVNYEDSDV